MVKRMGCRYAAESGGIMNEDEVEQLKNCIQELKNERNENQRVIEQIYPVMDDINQLLNYCTDEERQHYREYGGAWWILRLSDLHRKLTTAESERNTAVEQRQKWQYAAENNLAHFNISMQHCDALKVTLGRAVEILKRVMNATGPYRACTKRIGGIQPIGGCTCYECEANEFLSSPLASACTEEYRALVAVADAAKRIVDERLKTCGNCHGDIEQALIDAVNALDAVRKGEQNAGVR